MYTYYYKKPYQLFWRKAKNLKGHRIDDGKMVFFHVDGSQTIIAQWCNYNARLGTDWMAYTKQLMEDKSSSKVG